MGKVSVSNITVSLGFVVVPKALAMACLLAAASFLAILPLSSSQFCPLVPYCFHPLPGWHPTARHRLAHSCYLSAGTLLLIVIGWHPLYPVAPLAIYPSDRLAPPWLHLVVVLHCLRDYCPTPWSNVMTCLTVQHGFGGTSAGVFLCRRSPILPSGPKRALAKPSFLLFCGACGSVWVFLPAYFYELFPYVAGVYYLRRWAGETFPIGSGCLIFPMKR